MTSVYVIIVADCESDIASDAAPICGVIAQAGMIPHLVTVRVDRNLRFSVCDSEAAQFRGVNATEHTVPETGVQDLKERMPDDAVASIFWDTRCARQAGAAFDTSLSTLLRSTSDSVICPRYVDHICCKTLYGFALGAPHLAPTWNTEKKFARVAGVPAGFLIGTGRATGLACDALLGGWPHTNCALLASLHAWLCDVPLLCCEDLTVELLTPLGKYLVDPAPSCGTTLLRQQLVTWYALAGEDVMFVEAVRLSLIDPEATDAAVKSILALDIPRLGNFGDAAYPRHLLERIAKEAA